ncbi:MAG: hypothetical protein R6X02_14530 [Enhygromyxa sp.]
MLKKFAIITALATSAVVLAPAQQAEASCKSNWMKLSDSFRKLSPIIAKGVCTVINKDDKDAANKCIADYEQAKEEVEKIVKVYNQDAGEGKIGPRGLGTDRWYTGKLQAERTFIGLPVLSDEYTVEFKGDGGKDNNSYTVEICFVDPDDGGNVIEPVRKTFTNNHGSYKKTFKGVYGARPMVYLKNSKISATKAHRYKLFGSEGGEPKIVADARALLSSGTKTKAPLKKSPIKKKK